jgi:acetyl esterase
MRSIQFDLPVKEITYKEIGERKLKLYVFEPDTKSKDRTAILFFNGGSFKKGPLTPAQFQYQAHYFSTKGIVAICVDYRNGHDEGFLPMQAFCDAKSAVSWVRNHSIDLGVNPSRIVMCGASAGGYTSISSIMFGEFNDDQSEDYFPNALIVFAAVMVGVDIMGRLFPELFERATDLSPLHHIKKCLPSTLWMCGTADEIYEQNKRFVDSMNECGNDITFVTYEGMGHGFFNYGWHDNNPYNETTLRVEEYLREIQFI